VTPEVIISGNSNIPCLTLSAMQRKTSHRQSIGDRFTLQRQLSAEETAARAQEEQSEKLKTFLATNGSQTSELEV
jgi:hypothetical protein